MSASSRSKVLIIAFEVCSNLITAR